MQLCLLLHCAVWDSEADDFQEWETLKEMWGQTNWWGLSHFQPLPVSTWRHSQRHLPLLYVDTTSISDGMRSWLSWRRRGPPRKIVRWQLTTDYITIEISELDRFTYNVPHITISFTVIFAADVKVTYDTYRNCMIGTCDQKTLIITNPGIYWFWVYAARMQILDVDC